MTISALIPAYNEAERIAATIAAVRALPGVTEIIVVDDGSTDETAKVAETAGADTVLRQNHAGKGAALNAAFALSGGSIVLLLDADLGDSAKEAEKLLAPILHGAAEMAIATLPGGTGKGGGMGFAVNLARNGIERLTGRRMSAPLSGQRGLRRHVVETVGGFAEGWGAEVALTVRAIRAGFRVVEIPTEMTHRVTGRHPADILHRFAQYRAVRHVLAELRLPDEVALANAKEKS